MIAAAIVPSDYMPALPEIWMMVMICVTLLAGLFAKKDSPLIYIMSQLVLFGAALCTWYSFTHYAAGYPGGVLIFHHQFVLDALAAILKLIIYLIVFIVFLYSRQYNKDRSIPSEFYVLG